MSVHSADTLAALFKQLNCKSIVYNKAYYKLTASVAGAVLLSHLAYLYSEVFGGEEFYQSDAQLMDSLGFSLKTLRNAKESIKLFVTATKRGIPAKNHWVVHEEIIIQELLKLPPPQKRGTPPGNTSHAEKGTTGDAEKGTTGDAEKGMSNNKELQKNKELKNNNSVVDKKLLNDALTAGINEGQLRELILAHGEAQVSIHLEQLLKAKKVSTPIAWLTYAIKHNIAPSAPTDALVAPKSPTSGLWDENKYKAACKEAEALCDPNDWREKLISATMAGRV